MNQNKKIKICLNRNLDKKNNFNNMKKKLNLN